MKTARFFCENCGRPVPFNAEMCSNCGKHFDAVKCPVCNYTGLPGEFLSGCPKCGYLASDDEGRGPDAAASARRPIPTRIKGTAEGDEILFEERRRSGGGISTGVYFAILVLMVGILTAMAVFLFM